MLQSFMLRKKGAIFWRYLWIVLLITYLPMLTLGVVVYYVGTEHVAEEASKAHVTQLNQSLEQINEYMYNLEKLALKTSFDPYYNDSWDRMNFTEEFDKTKDLMKSLTLLGESNPLIQSVGFYLQDLNLIIGDESGLRHIETNEDTVLFRSLLDKEQTMYWNYSLKQIQSPSSSFKTIVIKLPGDKKHPPFGALLFYLNQEKLNKMIQKLASDQGVSFLIDENGQYLTSYQSDDKFLLGNELQQYISQGNVTGSSFKYSWGHQTYLVSYGKITKIVGGKWTVISATPLSEVNASVTALSRLIIILSSAALLIGILVSWIASRQLYAPIRRLTTMFDAGGTKYTEEQNEITYIENEWKHYLQEKNVLNTTLEQSIPALRDSFLVQFLQGNLFTYSESEIMARLKQLDWNIEDKSYAFIISSLYGYSDLGEKYCDKDGQLISFAASNILLEICSEKTNMVHVINFQEQTLGAFIVLESNKSQKEIIEDVSALTQNYVRALNNVLRMKATVVMSKITQSIVEAPEVLEQTRKALRFRDLQTPNQILDMNGLVMENTRQVQFPSKLEKEIVQAIGMGLEDEAVRLVRQFMLELQKENSTEWIVHQGMMKLLGTIHDLVIKYNIDFQNLYQDSHLYEQLMKLNDSDEIVEWFRLTLIRPLIRKLSKVYDIKTRKAVEDLYEKIQQEYLSDISLELYADQMSMTSSKLSRVFKQVTGVAFMDYILSLRIDKCKELLITTDMTISEIGEVVRYKPSYLIRIFKKYVGITPGQYRDENLNH